VNEIIPIDLSKNLPENYQKMTERISEIMPRIRESNESFYKSDSQLKMVTLDITDLTDVSSAKHILARIERRKLALEESEFELRKKKVKLAKKQAKLSTAAEYDKALLEIEILELQTHIQNSENYQKGAIREVAFLIEQYDAICQKLGVEVITEEMYEEDQPKFHVMRAFSQALAAARARSGLVDEGNFIYFQDLGINGAAAQREIVAYFEMEQDMLNQGAVPTFEVQRNWLEAIADKFAGEVKRYAEHRGFNPLVSSALAQQQIEAK
jgi:hypothetical protein